MKLENYRKHFEVNKDKMMRKFVYSDIKTLFKQIHRGYFLELYNRVLHSTEKYYSDYMNTYIDRDSKCVNISIIAL